MHKPLVSIITPCYNGENHIDRYFDAILRQTYRNIELIFINNGSQDKTEEIALSYKEKLKQAGVDFHYFYQENNGAAGALNFGLKKFTGEYLTWPDSDDILHDEYIEKKVSFLENNKDIHMVISKSRIIDEDTMKQLGILVRVPPKKEDDLFADLVFDRNVYYTPGGYMIRSSAFLETNPEREIFITMHGQNLQILLPMAYNHKYGYIDEFLYDYIVRHDSYTRNIKTKEQHWEKTYIDEDLILNVLADIDLKEDRDYYLDGIKKKYMHKRMRIAYQFKDKVSSKTQYVELKKLHSVNMSDFWLYHRTHCKLIDFVLRVFEKLKRTFRRDRETQ